MPPDAALATPSVRFRLLPCRLKSVLELAAKLFCRHIPAIRRIVEKSAVAPAAFFSSLVPVS